MTPVLSKEFLDIQSTIECGFTLKRVRDMTGRCSQIIRNLLVAANSSLFFEGSYFYAIILNRYLYNEQKNSNEGDKRKIKSESHHLATIEQYNAAVINDSDIDKGRFSFLGEHDANIIERYFNITNPRF